MIYVNIFNLLDASNPKPAIIIFSTGMIKIIVITLIITFYIIVNPFPKATVIDNNMHYLRKYIIYLEGLGWSIKNSVYILKNECSF